MFQLDGQHPSALRRNLRSLLTAAIFLCISIVSTACGPIHYDYQYPGQEISKSARTELRIAVLPFEDQRESFDEGNLNLAYIPLVPTAGRSIQQRQSAADRNAAEYYYPGLIAHSIQTDLRKNDIAAVVHFAPPVLEHYDLVVSGTLTRLEISARRNTYGLSFLGQVLTMVFIPTGYTAVDSEAVYQVSLPSGEVLSEEEFRGSWGSLSYTLNEEDFLEDTHAGYNRQQVHGIIKCFEEMNDAFISSISEPLTRLAEVVSANSRQHDFYAALDPHMNDILLAMADGASPALHRSYQQRQQWLEKYREHEWSQLSKEEEAKQSLIARRLQAIAQIRQQKREILRAEAKAERAKTKAFMGQFAQVLTASAQAMKTRTNAGYGDSAARSAFMKDMARGVGQIRPSQIPEFPKEQLLAGLNSNMRGLSAVDVNSISNLRAASIPELRGKFLQLYRRKFP